MPAPTPAEFGDLTYDVYGMPFVWVAAPGISLSTLEADSYGAPFVTNEGGEPTELWGAAVVRTVGGGATATTINHFGSGIAFVVATGFLDISTSAVEPWGEVPVTFTVNGDADSSVVVHAAEGTARTGVAGAAQLEVEAASVSAATARVAGATRAEVSTSVASAVSPSVASVLSLGLSLRGLVVATVRAFGRIVRFVPVPVLGVRVVAVQAGSATAEDTTVVATVLDTRAGTVTATHDSVAVRMVGQQAASCARVG